MYYGGNINILLTTLYNAFPFVIVYVHKNKVYIGKVSYMSTGMLTFCIATYVFNVRNNDYYCNAWVYSSNVDCILFFIIFV